MELHYITLKRQADFLYKELQNGIIYSAYTQKKNELILQIQIKNTTIFELVLSADSSLPFVILRDPSKRKKYSTNVMSDLVGQRILNIEMMDTERVMIFSFRDVNFQLYLQFFRNRSNFFIVDGKQIVIVSFKNNKRYSGKPYFIKESSLINPIQIDSKSFLKILKGMDFPCESYLKKNFLYLSPIVINELEARTGLDFKKSIGRIKDRELRLIHKEFVLLLRNFQRDNPRVYFKDGHPIAFTLTDFIKFKNYKFQQFKSVNEALIHYIFNRSKYERYTKKCGKLKNMVDQKIHHLQGVVQHLENIPDEASQRAFYQKQGELLLAQMSSLPSGQSEVEVIDFFDPKQPLIRIKLNPKLTIQENAQKYFVKAKAVSLRKKKLKQKLYGIYNQKKKLLNFQEILAKEIPLKDLFRIERELINMHIIQTDDKKLEEVLLPYRRYFYQDWEIWVGKNANANDQMTFRYAHKEDMWLHVQGTSGSHIIIRKQNRKVNVPNSVLNYAAKLAAIHSQAKHSKYVPVLFTKVKYVRKPKGSPPGVVMAEREKTIFIEPH